MGSREKMAGFLDEQVISADRQPESKVARQRIDLLLDDESFVELNSQVTARGITFGASRQTVAGDGVVTGYGTVSGRLVYVAAQDPKVYGGSLGQMHAEKIVRAIEMAVAAEVPFIGLYETGGARIEEGILGLEGLGDLLFALSEASGRIPLIAAIFGPCAGGAAFAAAQSDFVLLGENAQVFMNGPMVIAAQENKKLSGREIGGAEIHAEKSGLAMLTAADDNTLMGSVRYLLDYVPDSCLGFQMDAEANDDPNRTAEQLDQIAADLDSGYEMLEIIEHVFDRGSFLELMASYATGVIVGLARLDGRTVGVIANREQRLDAEMSAKAGRLAGICQRLNLPLITLVDAEGYLISSEAEQAGLVLKAAELHKIIQQMTVPRISVIVGQAIGTAYLTLSAKAGGTDFVYAWPTASIAVVKPDTAAHIIYRKEIAASADPQADRAGFVARYDEKIAGATVAAALGHVDEVIRPAATRPRLISALDQMKTIY